MFFFSFFFFKDTAPTEIYTVGNTLSLHDALPIYFACHRCARREERRGNREESRSEEHTSELQSLPTISYAVFCLKKKKNTSSYILDADSNLIGLAFDGIWEAVVVDYVFH